MIKVGIVSSINESARTVRVVYPDLDNTVTAPLPVIGNQNMPAVGDDVLVAYPDVSISDGYCLGVIPL